MASAPESPTSPRPSPPPGAERGHATGVSDREPLVFLNYTQAELDAAYNQAAYEANIQQLRDRWIANSERTRARIGQPERCAYGPSAIEQLDIFGAKAAAPAPIFVFIH